MSGTANLTKLKNGTTSIRIANKLKVDREAGLWYTGLTLNKGD